MSVREWLNRHTAATIAVVLLVTIVAGYFAARSLIGSPNDSQREWITMAYFYDQNTGRLFEVPADTVGPIETDSGPYQGVPAGVRAHVFSCGRCQDESSRFVAWLEVPESALPADAILGEPAASGEEDPDEGIVIRRPDDKKWVYPSSPQGLAIVGGLQSRCPAGARPNYCRPPSRLR